MKWLRPAKGLTQLAGYPAAVARHHGHLPQARSAQHTSTIRGPLGLGGTHSGLAGPTEGNEPALKADHARVGPEKYRRGLATSIVWIWASVTPRSSSAGSTSSNRWPKCHEGANPGIWSCRNQSM